MNTTTWIEILLIMAIAMWTQMGRRAFTTRRIFMPFIVAIIMGQQYLHGFPTSGSNLGALGLCLLVGILFGGLLVAATTVERDSSGVLYTKAGLPYLIIWVLELGSRVAFAYYAQSHQQQVGHFLLSHHLTPDVIGSGFMLMTIAMLVTRVLGIVVWGKWVRTSRKAVM